MLLGRSPAVLEGAELLVTGRETGASFFRVPSCLTSEAVCERLCFSAGVLTGAAVTSSVVWVRSAVERVILKG